MCIYMMSQKIIICGFPHCGTSILKSIIGHIEDVEEIYPETNIINKPTDKKFILCKFPFTEDSFFSKKYEDYIKIFIIRNPLFVFSSLNKRFQYEIPNCHSIDVYINTLKKFINYKNNSEKNVYTIRYEDIFENNFQELKIILDDIGVKYTNNIFDNSKYINVHVPNLQIPTEMPNNVKHEEYRTWQINQRFELGNDVSKLGLTEIQKQIIINDPHILEIYTDIGSVFLNIKDEEPPNLLGKIYNEKRAFGSHLFE